MSSTESITSIADQITKDGSSGYKAEKGRYHLYVSYGCPYAHRATIAVALKGLQDVFTIDVVDPANDGVNGWRFSPEKKGCTADTINGKEFLKEVYQMSHPNYTGRITVPVLFDKQTKKIVNNESLQIVRMLETEFNDYCSSKEKAELDLRPKEKANEIDDLLSWIVPNIVIGPYKCGNAKDQNNYDEAVNLLFTHLDKAEEILSTKRFLTGNKITEADIFIFVTLLRFDLAYYSLFKCNKKMIHEYKHLWGYVRDIYQYGDVATTIDISHCKQIYYAKKSPSIIPVGPLLNYDEKTDRENIV